MPRSEAASGPQVADLVRLDRQQNVRRAFRSFPLHELPTSSRTINPFLIYEHYLSGGRIALLPFFLIAAVARVLGLAVRSVYRVVGEILHPQVDQDRTVPPDTYWAALRKIHRMPSPCSWGRSGSGHASTWSTSGWPCPRPRRASPPSR